MLRFDRHGFGGGYTPAPSRLVPVYLGPRANDYFFNKTTGTGGDYPDGNVGLYGGTYYWDPIDLTPGAGYARAYDPSKPNNNWLRPYEYDGPGTVTFDMRPESAATALGQTQTQAYNDTSHGGALRNVAGTAGSLRWILDGGLFQNGAVYFSPARQFTNGATVINTNVFNSVGLAADSSLIGRVISGWAIPAGTTITAVNSPTQVVMSANATGTASANMFGHVSSVDRLIFHGTSHTDPITEWRRQFDIIRNILSVADPGSSIPNTQAYVNVWGDPRFAGNTYPCGFRLEGVSRVGILRADVAHCGDDGLFTGDATSQVITAGTAFSYILNNEGGSQGAGPTAWFHNDCWQFTGSLADSGMYDSTLQGHGAEWVAEGGHVRRVNIDRCWQGIAGADGGDFGATSYTMDSTVKVGSGAPTTRLSGHYYKGFSNGMEHRDGDPQVGLQVGNTGWHAVLVDQGGHSASLSNISVAVPAGVSVGGDAMVANASTAAAIAAFLASSDAPHQRFRAAYTTGDMSTVLADYGILLD